MKYKIENFIVVSTLNLGFSIQYRVVGEVAPQTGIVLIEPSREDGYIWLMCEQRTPLRASVV